MFELVKHEMVAVRLQAESGGMSENEWQTLPVSGRRSKDMERYKTRKKREVRQGNAVQDNKDGVET